MSASLTALPIFVLTASLALAQPRVWGFRINHSAAAIIGALLCLVTGAVGIPQALRALDFLLFPVITIVSLMVITLIAEQAGLFELLAQYIAKSANGNGEKLFTYLFFAGTLTGIVFTNDAAVLIFTPLVFKLIEEVQDESWTANNKTPYYFAVLYVANVVGALVISNPINIVVSRLFDIGFLEYARWMVIPAVVSIVTSYSGLRWFFRRSIPKRFHHVSRDPLKVRSRSFLVLSGLVLAITLVGFFAESFTGVPTWLVALLGAATLLILHQAVTQSGSVIIVRRVGWDVIIFVIGIFIVANGLKNAGLTAEIAAIIKSVSGFDLAGMTSITGIAAAVSSSLMNNHPTANTMALAIQDLALPPWETKMLAFAALIGGDLGPKMLPIGSLAALMWFRILTSHGVHIPYSLYIRIGIPVTLAAILLSVLALNLEIALYRSLTP